MLDQCWSTIYDAGSIVPHWVDVSCLLGDIYDKGCIHTRVKLRILQKSFQANTKHLYNICTMSAQRLRRWSNIEQILYKCFSCLLSCSCLHIQSVPTQQPWGLAYIFRLYPATMGVGPMVAWCLMCGLGDITNLYIDIHQIIDMLTIWVCHSQSSLTSVIYSWSHEKIHCFSCDMCKLM